MASVYYMTFDCADPQRLATFWATALSYEIDAPNEAAGEMELRGPTGEGPRLGFMKVPESKVVKNRTHLDLLPDTSLEAEVERLTAASATPVETLRDPESFVDPMHWTVMQDPEGNEFCVIERRGERT
jgi:predicted enzyme related to lactoylglutathione lyase